MGFGAKSSEWLKRLEARTATCETCGHCVPIRVDRGMMPKNDCKRQPLQVFLTKAPRVCRYHTKMEFLKSRGFNPDYF